MDKPMGNIKFTETETGFRLDIEGKDLKEIFARCCCNSSDDNTKTDCCAPSAEKK